MKFHIVQVNDRIQDISRKYNISIEEIIKLNRHINNIDNIVPGMKIRLPILSDEVSDQLKDNFLDVEKYYPKIEEFKDAKIEKKDINNKEDVDKEEVNNDDVVNTDYQQQYYYNPQQYYQSYYSQPVYQPQQHYYQQYQPYNYQQYQVQRDNINVPVNTNNPQQIDVNKQVNTENNDQALFNQPALCDPVLLNGIRNIQNEGSSKTIYQPYRNFYQNPYFTPPYPCSKPIEEFDNNNFDFKDSKIESKIQEFDEDVKEIKMDLREFVKKHTKIAKKKDNLDIL